MRRKLLIASQNRLFTHYRRVRSQASLLELLLWKALPLIVLVSPTWARSRQSLVVRVQA